jgi:putative oxidoreductase
MSRVLQIARVAAGLIFLGFGVAKFVNHGAEVESFETYDLPSPDAFVYAIGAIEVVGGLLLILGVATWIAALVLAGDMVGAIIVSGIGEGEPISLTLAPALLVMMVALVAAAALSRSASPRTPPRSPVASPGRSSRR